MPKKQSPSRAIERGGAGKMGPGGGGPVTNSASRTVDQRSQAASPVRLGFRAAGLWATVRLSGSI